MYFTTAHSNHELLWLNCGTVTFFGSFACSFLELWSMDLSTLHHYPHGLSFLHGPANGSHRPKVSSLNYSQAVLCVPCCSLGIIVNFFPFLWAHQHYHALPPPHSRRRHHILYREDGSQTRPPALPPFHQLVHP